MHTMFIVDVDGEAEGMMMMMMDSYKIREKSRY